jgi:hypothetical protein
MYLFIRNLRSETEKLIFLVLSLALIGCATPASKPKEPMAEPKAVASTLSFEAENTKHVYLNCPTLVYYSLD